MGASFDVPDDLTECFEKYIEESKGKPETYNNSNGFTLEVATELPELVEDLGYTQSNVGYNGNKSYASGGGNSFGGSRGGASGGQGGNKYNPLLSN